MLKTMICMIIVHLIIVYVTDLTDWPDSVKKAISWILTKGKIVKTDYRLHLIDCSTCLNVWIQLGIALIMNPCIYTIGFGFLLAFLAPHTYELLLMIKDILSKINRIIYKILRLDR